MLRKIFTSWLALMIFAALASLPAQARSLNAKREHLTEQEIELVREAQVLDKRTDVFIRAAERRLQVINGSTATASSKQAQKDMDKWGPLPKGSRSELLSDFSKILDEAINNIDDVAARDAKNPLVPKALRKLASAVSNFLPQINSMRATARDGEELSALEDALEHMQQITEAANRLPPPTEKKDKSKKEKSE